MTIDEKGEYEDGRGNADGQQDGDSKINTPGMKHFSVSRGKLINCAPWLQLTPS